jgi:hypothetical protein
MRDSWASIASESQLLVHLGGILQRSKTCVDAGGRGRKWGEPIPPSSSPLPPSFSLNAVLESLAVFCIRLHQLCILACSCLLGFFSICLQTGSEVLYFAEGWGRWWCAGHLVLVGVRSQSVICLCFRRSKQAHGFIGFQSFVFILTWRYLQTCSQSSTAGVSMHSPAPGQLLVLSLCLVSVLSPFSQQTLIAFEEWSERWLYHSLPLVVSLQNLWFWGPLGCMQIRSSSRPMLWWSPWEKDWRAKSWQVVLVLQLCMPCKP